MFFPLIYFWKQLGIKCTFEPDVWDEEREETCFDYDIEYSKGFHAMRSERQWYEYNRTDEMIKVENAYWMLSVDEFIAICTEDEADETLIDMNSLL